MGTTILESAAVATADPHDDGLKSHVRSLLTRLFPPGLPLERRHDGRFPFPYLIQLTPVDARTLTPIDETIVVVGKDLSERGLGFYHQAPLPFRRAVVTLEDASGRVVSLLMDMSWCRFTRHGWYDSGGRFLKVISTMSE